MHKTADVARIVGVKSVTVRKYAMALEKCGYSVSHSASGHREFSDTDIIALQELIALQKRTGLTVEKCAEVIAARHSQASESVAVQPISEESTTLQQYDERYSQLLRSFEQVVAKQDETIMRLNEQNQLLKEQRHDIIGELLIVRTLLEHKQKKNIFKSAMNFFKKNEPEEPEQLRDPEKEWNKRHHIEQDIYKPGRGEN